MTASRAFGMTCLLMSVLLSATPSVVMGFEGGGCGCTLGTEYVCGEGGYRCYCCGDPAHHGHDEGPAFSKCRMGDKLVMAIAPPADRVEHAVTPFVATLGFSYETPDKRYIDYYPILPGRPPTVLS